MDTNNPDQHRPVDARHGADAILPRFGSEGAGGRAFIVVPRVVDGHASKREIVGDGVDMADVFAGGLTVGMFAVLGSGEGRHRFLS